jgi:hypothetical protein
MFNGCSARRRAATHSRCARRPCSLQTRRGGLRSQWRPTACRLASSASSLTRAVAKPAERPPPTTQTCAR